MVFYTKVIDKKIFFYYKYYSYICGINYKKNMYKFLPGDKVICVLDFKTNLTIGKEYQVINVVDYGGGPHLVIKNDYDEVYEYEIKRFRPVGFFREDKINEIIK